MDLNALYLDYIELEKKLLRFEIDDPRVGRLGRCNLIFGFYYVLGENTLQKAKQHFYVCSLMDAFRIKKYQSRIFDYAIPSVGYALLSDNLSFLKEVYANLTYKTTYPDDKTHKPVSITMEEMVLAGEPAIYCHTIQQFIKNDTKTIERNLNLIETVTLPKKSQNPELMKLDFEFYKALYEKRKDKCEEILEQLVSPKIHKKRNDDPLLSKYVSQPALGYAKLAWMNDLEVETDSPLIPKELLPIKSNDIYEIPYDFLKND